MAREANAELLELPPEWEASDPAALLAAVANELHSTQEATRLSALLWLNTLLSRSRKTVRRMALPQIAAQTWRTSRRPTCCICSSDPLLQAEAVGAQKSSANGIDSITPAWCMKSEYQAQSAS